MLILAFQASISLRVAVALYFVGDELYLSSPQGPCAASSLWLCCQAVVPTLLAVCCHFPQHRPIRSTIRAPVAHTDTLVFQNDAHAIELAVNLADSCVQFLLRPVQYPIFAFLVPGAGALVSLRRPGHSLV